MKCFVFPLILLPLIGSAQEGWVRLYGGGSWEESYCVQQSNDGGFIVSGIFGWNDPWLLKLDQNGDTIWSRIYEKPGICHGIFVNQTSDNGYVLLTTHYWRGSISLIKTDTKGNVEWSKTWDDGVTDIGYCVQQTQDGGYIIVGVTDGKLWLIKTDVQGETIWNRTYGTGIGYCVKETTDGNYIVTGTPLTLMKVNNDGDTLWTRSYGSGRWLDITDDNGYIIIGHDRVFRTNPDGDTLWTRMYDFSSDGIGSCIQQTDDQGYIIGANSDIPSIRIWLLKLDSFGDTLWTRKFGGPTYGGPEEDFSCGTFIRQTADNGYVIVGCADYLGAGKEDIWVIKTDSLGNVPSQVSPVTIQSPLEGYALYKVTPEASFQNCGKEADIKDFYCHCEIVDINDSINHYHDSFFVTSPLTYADRVTIEFAEWTAPAISDFKATFYTTDAGPSGEKYVFFRWTGIEEQPPTTHPPAFSVVTGLGPYVLLSTSSEERLQLSIFDASGRLVDEVVLDGPGTVSWPVTPDGQPTGVYFIVPQEGNQPAQKVVIVR